MGRNKEEILKYLRYYKDKKVRVMILEILITLIDYSKLETSLAILMMETVNNMLIVCVFALFGVVSNLLTMHTLFKFVIKVSVG